MNALINENSINLMNIITYRDVTHANFSENSNNVLLQTTEGQVGSVNGKNLKTVI